MLGTVHRGPASIFGSAAASAADSACEADFAPDLLSIEQAIVRGQCVQQYWWNKLRLRCKWHSFFKKPLLAGPNHIACRCSIYARHQQAPLPLTTRSSSSQDLRRCLRPLRTPCCPPVCTATFLAYLSMMSRAHLSVYRVEYTLTSLTTAAVPGLQAFSMHIGRSRACIAAQCWASCCQPLLPSTQYVSILMTKIYSSASLPATASSPSPQTRGLVHSFRRSPTTDRKPI